jgi:lysophospholipase L1-like esterase
MRHIGFWLFLPFSALQGLWLRFSATRLPEATGDRTGINGQGEKLHLLAMGDSIIAGVISQQVNMLHIPTDMDPVHQEFCEDGFHPSAEACGSWAKELVQRLKSDTLAT